MGKTLLKRFDEEVQRVREAYCEGFISGNALRYVIREARWAADGGLESLVKFGSCVFNPMREELVQDDRVVNLEPMVLGVLLCLTSSQNRYFTRQELFDAVWGDDSESIAERAVTTAVCKLRKCLGADGWHIETVYGEGYMFVTNPEQD